MSLGEILFICRARLRERALLLQELLAMLGIAVGVALLFSSQVASTSLDGSVRTLTAALVGSTRWQLDARGPEGFSQRLVGETQSLPGVRAALPLIEQQASITGEHGQASIDLIGLGVGFTQANSRLFRHVLLLKRLTVRQLAHVEELALPAPLAAAIGAQNLAPVQLRVGARSIEAGVGATLHESEVGALVDGQLALAPLAYAQQITGMRGRVSRIYVVVRNNHGAEAYGALSALAAKNKLNLEPASYDARLFAVASAPAEQSERFFSTISAIVGFLFALSAMLLTVPTRRRLIYAMRRRGTTRLMTVQILAFDATVVGLLACCGGVGLGWLLSADVFRSSPGYLAFAFPISSEHLVSWQDVIVAVAAGMAAAFVGVLAPLRAILTRPLRSTSSAEHPSAIWTASLLGAGGLGIAVTTLILALRPQAAVVGSFTLALALVCLLPFLFQGAVAAFGALQGPLGGEASHLAAIELRDPANRGRALAVAATGAIAVFGAVAMIGAQQNLQSGLNRVATGWNMITDLWVSPRGVDNALGTSAFTSGSTVRLARLPEVKSVDVYRGGFLDVGDRRVWVIAAPDSSKRLIPAGQIVEGNPKLVNERLRNGGWTVISEAIAKERHLRIGNSFALPSPVPTQLRVAGLSTNEGWPPGAIVMSSSQYASAWGSQAASALNVTLKPGVSIAAGRAAVKRALGSQNSLSVQSAAERAQQWRTVSHQGLARLTQIAMLALIAAVAAMAIVTSSMIWQRRGRIARAKRLGLDRWLLWRALLWESTVLLSTGCLIGAAFGLYGQLLLSAALASVTGFPVNIGAGAGPLVALASVAIVSAAALVIVAIPGALAVRVRASTVTPQPT
jgi:putative ABC transport system permease protein